MGQVPKTLLTVSEPDPPFDRDTAERRRLESERENAVAQHRDVKERLALLVEASGRILASIQAENVHSALIEISRRLIRADAYAIWRVDPMTGRWQIAAATGLSAGYQQEIIETNPHSEPIPLNPMLFKDVDKIPLLAGRRNGYHEEGIRSLLVMPIRPYGAAYGTITFYYRTETEIGETDVQVATAIANLAGAAICNAEAYARQMELLQRAEAAEQRASFLAQASAALASSLDYETTLQKVAQAAVPKYADWCQVDLLSPDGAVQRVAITHSDAAKLALANELRRRYPVLPDAPMGVGAVLRTGRPELYTEVTDAMLLVAARDEEHLRILRELGFCSLIIVPLTAHGRILGAMSFVGAKSGRRYGPDDLVLAEDLARRAALAIDSARLYHQARLANQLKDEFLATVSHELRTPLSAILGWTHIARRRGMDEKSLNEAFTIIDRNARAQAQIVEDLLDVSRIISGKLKVKVEPVDLAATVTAAVDLLHPAASAKQVSLKLALDPKAAGIAGDADRLQQIVWNLLSNAIKFTPNGGQVDILLEQVGDQIELTVRDSGRGISAEFLPFVFDRFRQAESTFTRTYGGLGLGLAIVRHLVELHGGTVSAASEGEGRGASFTLKLPIRRLGDYTETSPQPNLGFATVAQPKAATELAGLRILLVEDEADFGEMLLLALSDYGAQVTVAPSVREALALLGQSQFELIISDIEIPDEDGFSLIRQVRAGGGKRLPALALTAYAGMENRVRALTAGFDQYLAKPVEVEDLVAVILKLTGRASLGVSLSS